MQADAAEWPPRHPLFGSPVSAVAYDDAVAAIMNAARTRTSACVSALAVHGLMTASADPAFGRVLSQFDMVLPDGQPVRFALNVLHGAGLRDRVYGPELMLRVCRACAAEGIAVYLYGSTRETVERLAMRLPARVAGLRVAGFEPSVFRPLTAPEDNALMDRIRSSGAGVVFLGLGCPRQEQFASEHRQALDAVQICVGAAFDFHAGTKPMAPAWMQRRGLEWLFRLSHEPRRLGRRYATTNTSFVVAFAKQWLAQRFGGPRAGVQTQRSGGVS